MLGRTTPCRSSSVQNRLFKDAPYDKISSLGTWCVWLASAEVFSVYALFAPLRTDGDRQTDTAQQQQVEARKELCLALPPFIIRSMQLRVADLLLKL